MEPEKKSNGALVGLVVIVLILVIGGVYIWYTNKENLEISTPQTQPEAVSDQDAAALNALELEAENMDTSTGVDAEVVY